MNSREVRLGNLWNRVWMEGSVALEITTEVMRRFEIERKCLEAREKGFNKLSSPLVRNSKIDSQQSSGKWNCSAEFGLGLEEDLREFLVILFLFIVDEFFCRRRCDAGIVKKVFLILGFIHERYAMQVIIIECGKI
ncbi:hypothetical protein A2U01_0043462 [Trifolium medium]|uniref:Uncharacterized protein n=1 Tax=Trifolium medium TaxID=97028 RepID=A0A392QFH6_9FABA|nr:hypothetical protein [Trifolium medium]